MHWGTWPSNRRRMSPRRRSDWPVYDRARHCRRSNRPWRRTCAVGNAGAGAGCACERTRARLVHLLCRGHPDRLRSVCRHLSHRAVLDAVRHRSGADRRRTGGARLPDAGRGAGRLRPLGAGGRCCCGCCHLSERGHAGDVADLHHGAGCARAARGGQLRARPRHRHHQPQACWPWRSWRTARAQCPLRLDRKWRRRRRDGRLRISGVQPGRVLHDRRSCRAGNSRACADQRPRYRACEAPRSKSAGRRNSGGLA